VSLSNRRHSASLSRSAFAGCRFPVEVIVVAVRWYLRYGLSYRDVEELLAERGVEVDHVTVYRWVQRFAPLFADAARFTRHAPGDRWFVDETYVKVGGVWRYVYRAVDQHGQIIDVLVSKRRDGQAARRFFSRALTTLKVIPTEVVTDAAPVYPRVLDELVPAARHHVEQYANNRIEADHSRLKHRLRPMRGLRTDRAAQVIIAGLAFIQNLRRGPLRTHHRNDTPVTCRRRVHRTRPSDLTDASPRHHAAHRSANATEPPKLLKRSADAYPIPEHDFRK
jgi:transposase-like protein